MSLISERKYSIKKIMQKKISPKTIRNQSKSIERETREPIPSIKILPISQEEFENGSTLRRQSMP